MNVKEQLVLIDGHAMLYRAYYAFPPTLTTKDGTIVNAVYGFTRILLALLKDLKPKFLAVSFDVGKSFRHDLDALYKAKRAKIPDDLKQQEPLINTVLEALAVPVITKEGYEADDVIGTIAHQATEEGVKTIIVTGDMDAMQLVRDECVSVLVPQRAGQPPKIYTEALVQEKYGLKPSQIVDYKGLAGDNSDNIPGVSGIGQKTAVKLLTTYGSIEGIYQALEGEDRHGLLKGAVRTKLLEGKESAMQSQKLATIITDLPITFTLADCEVRRYDKTRAVELFEQFGFKSLIAQLPDDSFEHDVQEALF